MTVSASSRVIITDGEAEGLDAAVRDAAAAGLERVWLVVPVEGSSASDLLRARARLDRALRRLRGWGIEVHGHLLAAGQSPSGLVLGAAPQPEPVRSPAPVQTAREGVARERLARATGAAAALLG